MRGCIRLREDDLDAEADPLVDLDAHVNGRWRAGTTLPPHRARWDAFIALNERSLILQARIARRAARGRCSDAGDACARVVGDLWTSGLTDDVSVADLGPEFERIAALDGPEALAAYICERHARGWPLLFSFGVAPAFDAPGEHLACLAPAPAPGPGPAPIAAAVVALETELARLRPAADAPRDIAASQRRVALDAANSADDVLRWPALFGAAGVRAPRSISLAEPQYFIGLQSLLRTAPAADWRAWLRWQAVHSMANVLDEATATRAPRWQRVLEAINAAAGDAMGALFMAAQPKHQERVRAVQGIAERLREAFAARLRALDWLSEAARTDALRKLAAMRFKIGGPAQVPDFSLCPTAPAGWLENLAAVRTFAVQRRLAALDRSVERDEWTLKPQNVNAVYDPHRNDVTIPLALLGPPLFDPRASRAAWFGGIGAVLAHEMTHGFDTRGRRFDPEGRLRDQWSETDSQAFATRAEHLRRYVERCDGQVNGARVLDETLADFGGLAIACDALRAEGLTGPTELRAFFVSWAALWRQHTSGDERERRLRLDTHAPSPLRAHAPAADLPAFHGAFGQARERVAGEPFGVW